MAFSAGSSSGTLPEINVTPLIDVLLVLLIIFMVIGPALQHGLNSSAPPATDKSPGDSQPAVTVRILAGLQDGGPRYRIDQQATTFAEIRPRLQQMFATRQGRSEDRTLYLQADRSLSYREVALVAGEGRAAGAAAIALIGEAGNRK